MGLWNFLTKDRSDYNSCSVTIGSGISHVSNEDRISQLEEELLELKKLLKYQTKLSSNYEYAYFSGFSATPCERTTEKQIVFPDGTIRSLQKIKAGEKVIDIKPEVFTNIQTKKPSKKKAKG